MAVKALLVLFSQAFFVQVISGQCTSNSINAATANSSTAGPSSANHEPSFGHSLTSFGPSLTSFGPSLGDYCPTTTANRPHLAILAANRLDMSRDVGASSLSNSRSSSNRFDLDNSPVAPHNGEISAAPEFVNEDPVLVRDLFIRADLERYEPVDQVGISYACGDGGIVLRNEPVVDAGGSLELGARTIQGPNGLTFGPVTLGIDTSRLSRGFGATRIGLGAGLGFGAGIRPGVLGACNNR